MTALSDEIGNAAAGDLPGFEPGGGESKRYRAIWISDFHLGTRGCKSGFLLDFLKSHDSQYLYLVGDVIDGWQLSRSWNWPQSHNDIVQKILRKVRKGTQVVYIPGNNDEFLRTYHNMQFGGVTVVRHVIHVTADGRRLWVMHGDFFDAIVTHSKWLAVLGSNAYDLALFINHWFNYFRQKLGYPYWSLSAYVKHKVKNAVKYITRFENIVVQAAKNRNVDGVVCGHIHKAEMREIEGVLYCNTGDWVESCTALVEDFSGKLELIHWMDAKNKKPGKESKEKETVKA